jgi:hypothetical protein
MHQKNIWAEIQFGLCTKPRESRTITNVYLLQLPHLTLMHFVNKDHFYIKTLRFAIFCAFQK